MGNNTENKKDRKIRIYVLSKEGTMPEIGLVNVIVDMLKEEGELEDLGFGSAYNMPIYLLGEIEGHEEDSFVIALDTEGDELRPRFLVGKYEIGALMVALEACPNEDAWQLAVDVNKDMRAMQAAHKDEQ